MTNKDSREFSLNEIANHLQFWLDYDCAIYEREGKPVPNDAVLMAPPEWPSHEVLRNWIKVLSAQ